MTDWVVRSASLMGSVGAGIWRPAKWRVLGVEDTSWNVQSIEWIGA